MLGSRARVRWGLVVLWTGVVLTLSGASFGSEQTGAISLPLLERLFPDVGHGVAVVVHVAIRKAAHLGEYLVLAFLTARALRLTRPATFGTLALAIGWAVAVALVDEVHQATLPGRNGSPADVLLDGAGAGLGAMLALAGDRLRGTVAPLQAM